MEVRLDLFCHAFEPFSILEKISDVTMRSHIKVIDIIAIKSSSNPFGEFLGDGMRGLPRCRRPEQVAVAILVAFGERGDEMMLVLTALVGLDDAVGLAELVIRLLRHILVDISAVSLGFSFLTLHLTKSSFPRDASSHVRPDGMLLRHVNSALRLSRHRWVRCWRAPLSEKGFEVVR